MRRIFWLCLICVFSVAVPVAGQTYQTPEELADPGGLFADVQGASIYYITAGDPADPAVVLIHGFGGSTFTWRDVMPVLAEAGFYAIALDLPPFGLSDKNPDLNVTRSGMADMVAGLMDELSIERATIVGHSMGGAVTAQFAVRHSKRVERLVFVAGGIFEARTPEQVAADGEREGGSSPLGLLNRIDPKAPAAPLLLRALVTRDFFANTLLSAYYDPETVSDEAIDGYARILLIEDAPVGFLAYVQAQETEPVTLIELMAVTDQTPVLILWGEEDTWVPIALGELMSNALADVTFVRYPLVGHLPMEENTEAFNADLIAFLQSE